VQGGYSLEKELALGKRLVMDTLQRSPRIDDTLVQQYVDTVGQRMAALMPEAKLPFTFYVVGRHCAASEPDAFPGGYVLIPAELLLSVHSDAEFERLLVHAMAHITLRHSLKPLPNTSMGNIASIPLVFVGTSTCNVGRLAVPVGLRDAVQANEVEAEKTAIAKLAEAGIDPNARDGRSPELTAVQQRIVEILMK
jgi:predicted Zn-dependent protease